MHTSQDVSTQHLASTTWGKWHSWRHSSLRQHRCMSPLLCQQIHRRCWHISDHLLLVVKLCACSVLRDLPVPRDARSIIWVTSPGFPALEFHFELFHYSLSHRLISCTIDSGWLRSIILSCARWSEQISCLSKHRFEPGQCLGRDRLQLIHRLLLFLYERLHDMGLRLEVGLLRGIWWTTHMSHWSEKRCSFRFLIVLHSWATGTVRYPLERSWPWSVWINQRRKRGILDLDSLILSSRLIEREGHVIDLFIPCLVSPWAQ